MPKPVIRTEPGWEAPDLPGNAQQRQVQEMLNDMAQQVAAMDPAVLRQLMPVLMDAKREVAKGLQAWLGKGVDNDKRFTAHDMRKVMANLDTAMDTIARLEPQFARALEDMRKDSGHLALDHLKRQVARMAHVFNGPEGMALMGPQIDTAAVILRAKKELIQRHRNSAHRYTGTVLKDIRHQFGLGLARGETFHQMHVRLRNLGGPKGKVSLRGVKGEPNSYVEDIPEGLFRRYRHWAERLVRTETMNAYNVQHAEGIDDLNDDLDDDEDPFLKRWDATLDSRICPICGPLHGVAVDPDEDFPGGYSHPPAHPYCRCIVVAWSPEWGGIKGEKGPATIRGKAADPAQREAARKQAAERKAAARAKAEAEAKRKAEDEAKRKRKRGKEKRLEFELDGVKHTRTTARPYTHAVVLNQPGRKAPIVSWHLTEKAAQGVPRLTTIKRNSKGDPVFRRGQAIRIPDPKATKQVVALGKRKADEAQAELAKLRAANEAKRKEIAKIKAANEAKRKQLAALEAAKAKAAKRKAEALAKAKAKELAKGDKAAQLDEAKAKHQAARDKAHPFEKAKEDRANHRRNRTANIVDKGATWHMEEGRRLDHAEAAAKRLKPDTKALRTLELAAAKERKIRASMTTEERTQYTAAMAAQANTRAPKRHRRMDSDADWTKIRHEIDAELQLDGAVRRSTDKEKDVRIRSIKALGQHYQSGLIEMRPTELGKAKRFAKAFSTPKRAKAARKAMDEAGAGLQKVKAQTHAMERQMKASDKALAGLKGDDAFTAERKAEDLKLSKPGTYPMSINGRPAEMKLADQYWEAERKGDELLKERRALGASLANHKGVKLMKDSDGMSTLVHEAYHGHGPSRGAMAAYQGAGKVVEEVTTELSARAAMRRNYGVPQIVHDTGGGYGWVIDPLTDKVAEVYGVDRAEARTMMDKASAAIKADPKAVDSGSAFRDLFTSHLPASGRGDIAAELDRLTRVI